MSGMAEEIVRVEKQGTSTKTLFLNRPERANALNSELVKRLTGEIVKCYADQTKLLIIRGEGKHFCSGFDRDPATLESDASGSLLGVEIESMLQVLAGAPFVTLAHIHGAAVGAGADIAVACDYRCATTDASMAFPGFRLVGVSLGNSRLSQCIGPDQAMKLILQSRRIGSEEAHQLGLITNIVEIDSINQFITELELTLENICRDKLSHLKHSTLQVKSRQIRSLG